jgi:hypothetical protein
MRGKASGARTAIAFADLKELPRFRALGIGERGGTVRVRTISQDALALAIRAWHDLFWTMLSWTMLPRYHPRTSVLASRTRETFDHERCLHE